MKPTILAALLAAACALAHAATIDGAAAPMAASSATSGVDPAAAARRAADDAKLKEAQALIQSRQSQAAIDRVLDPLIAAKAAENAGRKETLYCANSQTETLVYLLQAAAESKNAVALDGTLCNALFLRGYAEVEPAKYPAAEADFARAVAMSPNNPRYLSEVAALHVKRREWAEVLVFYHRAEDNAKAFSPEGSADWALGVALRGTGYVDVEPGKLDEAEAAYRRCLQIDPNDQKSRAELGYVLGLRQKAGQAR